MTSLSALYDEVGEINGYLTIAADVTRRKKAEQKVEFMAHHDALTHLPNRLLIEERFKQAIESADQQKMLVALMFIDLGRFKAINDSFGHSIGDAYLKEIARRLTACVRTTDTVSRQGGDEFLVLLNGVSHRKDIPPILAALKQRLQEPVKIDGHELSVYMSIGVSLYPHDGRCFADLLKKSDMAMYRAKEEGKNTYRFFDERMDAKEADQNAISIEIKRALQRNEFVLHYQPQIDLISGKIVGAEALIRWMHPEQGLMPPTKFIRAAEESGLIVPLGEWVIHEACRQAAEWQRTGLEKFSIAVNLSAAQFKSHELEETILAALTKSGIDAEYLELELTESFLIQDTELVQTTMKRLKGIGVKISIDDFGTGYSSLSYLKRLDVDKLKIDRSFIKDLANDQDDRAIVKAIIQMAKSLRLTTVAEGVANLDRLHYLQEMRCSEAQGFYFAKPMPAPEFEKFIAGNPLILHLACS